METLPAKNPLKPLIDAKSVLYSEDTKQNVIVFKRQVLTTKKAVELLLNGTLKSKVCRYCLYITSPLSELDQIMQIANKGALYKVTIRNIVASSHPFKVINDPNFPSKICEKCLNKAIRSYFFTQQCEQSERALKNCFVDMYDKLEKLDPLKQIKKRGRQKLHPNHNILYTEHHNVIDYAEPVHNLINTCAVSLTYEPSMSDLECKKCWQVLPNVESLANHEKIHPKTSWYNCRLCGKSFSKKIHMKRHLRVHAKGKLPDIADKEAAFICKQCGNSTDNHDLHLQHMEKHKFHMVLEHLVERKMDKLCSVCLSNSGKLVEMNKMICLHGGYPELTGDRTLYNILGATIPEPNYKYQELLLAQKPKILKITKKNTNVIQIMNTESCKYIISLPDIISLEKINFDRTYDFAFSGPENCYEIEEINQSDITIPEGQTSANINPVYDAKSMLKVEVDKDIEENKSTDDTITQDDIELSNQDLTQANNNNTMSMEVNEDADDISEDNYVIDNVQDLHNDKKKLFRFSEPILGTNAGIKDICKVVIPCSKCWIFKKPMCANCTDYKEVHKSNSDMISEMNILSKAKPCQFCWIFKHVDKCEYCKKSTTEGRKNVQEEKIETEFVSKKENDVLKATKRKLNPEDTNTTKKARWQCEICLTKNNLNRETCVCCQSEKNYIDTVKLNFNYNFTKFMKTNIMQPEENLDINQNEANFEHNDTKTKTVEVSETIENQEQKIENMESANSIPAVSDNETSSLKLNTFDEIMDIVTEDEYFLKTTANLKNEDISPTERGTTSTSTFYPNPYSLCVLSVPDSFRAASFTNAPQFNIGAPSKDDKMMNILQNHTGTKICETCLDHAIISYIFMNKTHYIRNRLDRCITNMIESLKDTQTDNKIFIEVAQNGIMPITDTYDENLLLDDDEIEETKLKVEVLEDEFRIKSEDESSSDENDIKTINTKVDKNVDSSNKNTGKLVNGYKISSDIGEFLTFKKEALQPKKPKCKYTCPICNKLFINDYFLKKHILKHVNRKVQCKYCSKFFKSKFCLHEHVKANHLLKLQNASSCNICSRTFKNVNKKGLHEKCHKNKHCDLCSKFFVHQRYYDSHMQRHACKLSVLRQQKVQNCSFCEKECFNDDHLSVHVNKVHLHIKPYACDMCNKQFYTDQNLKKHKVIHSMFSMQKCELCSKLFKCRRNLVVHIRKHIGIKPLHCSVCPQTFYSEIQVKQHMKKWHGGSFFCKLCKKVFVNKKGLKDHVNGAHSIF